MFTKVYAIIKHFIATYITGGYIEEISTLPPSVTEVATAIPAFIGYTEKGPKNTPTRITSMMEYEQVFGRAKMAAYSVTIDHDNIQFTLPSAAKEYIMYPCLKMFFENGGGVCYIVSAGNYSNESDEPDEPIEPDAIRVAISEVSKVDEPTLVILVDAVYLKNEYHSLCQEVLVQCSSLQDRFGIFDVLEEDDKAMIFRERIGIDHLMYGAAYFPYLETLISYEYDEQNVLIDFAPIKEEGPQPNALPIPPQTLASIKDTDTILYNKVKITLNRNWMTLPPSSAIAGIYARVDRTMGVWKAPANVSVSGIRGPAIPIAKADQEGFNVDVTEGKSINTIRSFIGKGTLVWGARTLAGNDNEWRYISVRRLLITIEESIKKSSAFVVFEPNDATTWLKVKAMIESYLYGLWQQGALAGSTPESAFFVQVGLGKTMTTQDILEGKLIVEIGIAAVRPSKFIILKFLHQLQEA